MSLTINSSPFSLSTLPDQVKAQKESPTSDQLVYDLPKAGHQAIQKRKMTTGCQPCHSLISLAKDATRIYPITWLSQHRYSPSQTAPSRPLTTAQPSSTTLSSSTSKDPSLSLPESSSLSLYPPSWRGRTPEGTGPPPPSHEGCATVCLLLPDPLPAPTCPVPPTGLPHSPGWAFSPSPKKDKTPSSHTFMVWFFVWFWQGGVCGAGGVYFCCYLGRWVWGGLSKTLLTRCPLTSRLHRRLQQDATDLPHLGTAPFCPRHAPPARWAGGELPSPPNPSAAGREVPPSPTPGPLSHGSGTPPAPAGLSPTRASTRSPARVSSSPPPQKKSKGFPHARY